MLIKLDRVDDTSLLEVDYSQQELRVAADLSGDKTMLECFLQRKDIHSLTAASVLGCSVDEVTAEQRNRAKPVNFSTIFDVSAQGMVEISWKEYRVSLTVSEAEQWIKGFFRLYRGYRIWMLREFIAADRRGCAHTYWEGKVYVIRWLPDLGSSSRKKRSHARRQVVNTPVQGGASLYLLKSANALHRLHYQRKIPGVISIMHTIHDSLIFTVRRKWVKRAFRAIARVMVDQPTRIVPLEVAGKFGPTLGDMRKCGVINAMDIFPERFKNLSQ